VPTSPPNGNSEREDGWRSRNLPRRPTGYCSKCATTSRSPRERLRESYSTDRQVGNKVHRMSQLRVQAVCNQILRFWSFWPGQDTRKMRGFLRSHSYPSCSFQYRDQGAPLSALFGHVPPNLEYVYTQFSTLAWLRRLSKPDRRDADAETILCAKESAFRFRRSGTFPARSARATRNHAVNYCGASGVSP
jgi:hypothetical protein